VVREFVKRHLWSISVAFVSLLLMAGVWTMANLELTRVWQSYSDQRLQASENEAKIVSGHFKTIYQSTNRVAVMPSVQNIDRHASMLLSSDKAQIQQVYSDVSLTENVSEIYITQASFNPGRLDELTGKLEEPAFSFDQNIVNGGRYRSETKSNGEPKAAKEQPEIESEEYAVIAEQINWFSNFVGNKYSRLTKNLPMISSTEALTCDNTIFNHTLLESDRRGIIFSVPFFNYSGKLNGVVSSIILSNKLNGFLTQPGSFLKSPLGDFQSLADVKADIDEANWAPSLTQKDADKNIVRTLTFDGYDPRGKWQIGSQFKVKEFYASAAFEAVSRFALRALILILTVAGVVILQIEMAQLRVAKLKSKVNIDQLTKLTNRLGLEHQLDKAAAEVSRGRGCTVFFLDLDKFKYVNDTFGHDAGDLVLRTTAQRLLTCVRGYDTVARLGGDEFVVVLPGLTSLADTMALAKRVIASVSQLISVEGGEVKVGTCIGIATANKGQIDGRDLVRQADVALNRAKGADGNNFRFYEPAMDSERERRKIVEKDLAVALQNNEFEVYYQPIIGMDHNKVSCFEALIRWNHPTRGKVPPMEFIELSEQTGQINEIGAWVLKQACRDIIKLSDTARVAVNISAVQIRNPEFTSHVIRALAASGLSAHRLELEITESVIMKEGEGAFELLRHLKSLGLRIALDDFGVGYSSLSYLTSFDFDKIKIDRSFVLNVEGKKETSILRAIMGLSAELGMTTTIEGVESGSQLQRVKELGCNEVQGFYFSKPKPIAELLESNAAQSEQSRSVA
jgi:diguanylate cyclase (GGDEF)-like protein